MSFNPQDNTQICITGNGIFKLFRYIEGALKQTNFQRGEPQNYLSHAWLSEERVIVGSDMGKLFLFESGDLRWETNIECKKSPSEIEKDELPKDSERYVFVIIADRVQPMSKDLLQQEVIYIDVNWKNL